MLSNCSIICSEHTRGDDDGGNSGGVDDCAQKRESLKSVSILPVHTQSFKCVS